MGDGISDSGSFWMMENKMSSDLSWRLERSSLNGLLGLISMSMVIVLL